MQPRDQLTQKEIQVATQVWEGVRNRDIAKVIETSEQVMKNYLQTTFDKLGVWSGLELALYVASQGGVNLLSEPALTEKSVRESPSGGWLGRLIRSAHTDHE